MGINFNTTKIFGIVTMKRNKTKVILYIVIECYK